MGLVIDCDGSSLNSGRGIPGHSGAGIVVWSELPIAELSIYLGKKTNNEAEYLAVFYGMKWVLDNRPERSLLVQTDSQLVIHQVREEWRVNDPRLLKLKERVNKLWEQFLFCRIAYQHWNDDHPPHTLAQRASKSQRDHIETFVDIPILGIKLPVNYEGEVRQ